MTDFLKQIDTNLDYKCKLIKGDDTTTFVSTHKKNQQSLEEVRSNLDSTFVQGIKTKVEVKSDVDLSKWRPNANILKENINTKDIFDQSEP
jgi:hypothetical protein